MGFRSAKELGDKGEAWVRAWLKDEGYQVIPFGLIDNGGAPKLEGWIESEILPDIAAVKDGSITLVEVKTKHRITDQRARKRLEHGIELHCWEDYQKVAQKMGLPCVLAILQLEPPQFYMAPLEEAAIGAVHYSGPNMPKPMIYFDMRRFELYDIEGEVPIPTMPINALKPWETKTVFKPQSGRQPPLF